MHVDGITTALRTRAGAIRLDGRLDGTVACPSGRTRIDGELAVALRLRQLMTG